MFFGFLFVHRKLLIILQNVSFISCQMKDKIKIRYLSYIILKYLISSLYLIFKSKKQVSKYNFE